MHKYRFIGKRKWQESTINLKCDKLMLIKYKPRCLLLSIGTSQSTGYQTKMEKFKTNKDGKKVGYHLRKVNLSQVSYLYC